MTMTIAFLLNEVMPKDDFFFLPFLLELRQPAEGDDLKMQFLNKHNYTEKNQQ